MRKSYLGILAVVLVMAALLMPALASATVTPATVTAEGCYCFDTTTGTVYVNLCAKGGTVHWDSYEVLKYDPILKMYVSQAIVPVNEDITDGTCVQKAWGTGLTGTYDAKVTYTIGDNPSKTDLLTCNVCEPCPPIPEVATISLMGLGILALGGYIYLRQRTRRAEAA